MKESKVSSRLLVLFAAAVTLLGTQGFTATVNDRKVAEKAIRKDFADITKAFHDRDATGAVAPYVKDDGVLVLFDLIPPLQQIGYAGALKSAHSTIDGTTGPITMDYTDVSVTVDGHHAYAHGFVHCAATLKDNSKIDMVMRVTDVFEEIRGEWLIVHEHASLPIDMKTGRGYMNADKSGPGVPFSDK